MPSEFDQFKLMTERDYDRKLSKIHQEDNLFTNRVNLFLIAESMLLISFVTSVNLQILKNTICFVFTVLGISVTIIFWQILGKNVKYIDQLKKRFEKNYPIAKWEKDIKPITYANNYLGDAMPIIFLIIWITFLFVSLAVWLG